MYNSEIAKREVENTLPAEYLKKVNNELASAITIVRNGAENDNWARVGEGIKRLGDCQVALKTYVEEMLLRPR